jgi:thioredoxin-related protein
MTQPATAAEPLRIADDLQADAKLAREQGVPVLLAFMLTTCPYCTIARRDYLVPMQASEQWRGKVIMREVVLDSANTISDFAGESLTAREFAKRYGIRSVPTVIVFDGGGAQVTQPLVGVSASDFYGLYLEQAIEAGLLKMRNPQR